MPGHGEPGRSSNRPNGTFELPVARHESSRERRLRSLIQSERRDGDQHLERGLGSEPSHSNLSATTGSTLDARRAGIAHATNVIPMSKSGTAVITAQSCEET